MIKLLYTFLYRCALPWLGKQGVERRRERLGFYAQPAINKTLWIHAASLGEVVALTPFVDVLLKKSVKMVITTMTLSGSNQVKKVWGERVAHVFVPFDIPSCVRRFFDHFQPVQGIIMETELWPNLLLEAKQINLPISVINARISDRSLKHYQLLRGFMRHLLSVVEHVGAQSAADGERFVALGLPRERLRLTGNIKFDRTLAPEWVAAAAALKVQLGDRFVITAASTHPGEDEQLLAAFKMIKQQIPNVLLILVPRHVPRFDVVAALLADNAFRFVRRSDGKLPDADTSIWLGDTMGEVNLFFGVSDIGFVGGSMVNIGGHNLLEPAMWCLPVLSGPYLQNFRDVRDVLLAGNALTLVADATAFETAVITLYRDVALREQQAKAALTVVEANRGALARTLAMVNLCD